MKKIAYIIIVLLICIFFGCISRDDYCSNEHRQNYTYTYTANITYTDGSIDTLVFSRDSFNGNDVHVYLKISENGLLTSAGISPCLVIGCGFYERAVACGVRKYEILNKLKVKLTN